MKYIVPWLGWFVFLYALANMGHSYGHHWVFGRYCMPHTLTAASGVTYRDGMPLDAVTLYFVQAGIEEEAELAAAGINIALIAVLVFNMVKLARLLRLQEELERR